MRAVFLSLLAYCIALATTFSHATPTDAISAIIQLRISNKLNLAMYQRNWHSVVKMLKEGADPSLLQYSIGRAIANNQKSDIDELRVIIANDPLLSARMVEKTIDTFVLQALLTKFRVYRNWEFKRIKMSLIQAACTGDLELLERALYFGADINVEENEALCCACEHGHYDAARMLIERGAIVSTQGEKPLRLAAKNGHSRIIQMLIDNDADIHINDDEPLRLAAAIGADDAVRILIRNNAKVRARESEALTLAAQNNHVGSMRILIENDANVNDRKFAALRFASRNGNYEAVECLLNHNVNLVQGARWAIIEAKKAGHTKITELINSKLEAISLHGRIHAF